MGAFGNTSGPKLGALIEWRAKRITDPVDRLRFLRQAAHTGPGMRINERFRRLGGWRIVVSAVLWASFFVPAYTPSRARGPLSLHRSGDATDSATPVVWPVERTAGFELYSNGLRIENAYSVTGKPRSSYPVFAVKSAGPNADQPVEWRTRPTGIVFHSTESLQLPFEASEAGMIQRIGRNLLDYVRSQQSYHFVIDRFGRVFRVVREEGIANHSGRSVWSDSNGTYINLNASFLSVAFEAQTDASLPMSAAQIHAARVLTDMLRGRFWIPGSNCVTHAQVSVNPQNWRIGYHTDWASGFPFAALGLPDNYAQPVPSITQFGFDYDDAFLKAMGRPWSGLLMASELTASQARSAGLTTAAWCEQMHERYRRIITSAQLRSNEESQDESFKNN